MPNKSFVFILLLVSCSLSFAQQVTTSREYKVRGVVKTQNSEVIAGLNLYVRSDDLDRAFITDINGEFELTLGPGDYQVTVNKVNSKDFKAFLKIVDGAMNPDGLVFILDPDGACCLTDSGQHFPKPLSLPRPSFPAAARATRASGEVVVDIKIGKDGSVVTAKSIAGHPLLRAAAEAAARGSKFEASDNEEERRAALTYAFIFDDEVKPGTVRYKNLFRIEMIPVAAVLDYTSR